MQPLVALESAERDPEFLMRDAHAFLPTPPGLRLVASVSEAGGACRELLGAPPTLHELVPLLAWVFEMAHALCALCRHPHLPFPTFSTGSCEFPSSDAPSSPALQWSAPPSSSSLQRGVRGAICAPPLGSSSATSEALRAHLSDRCRSWRACWAMTICIRT